MTGLPIRESINYGWNKFWERPWFFVGAYIIIGIFNYNYQYHAGDQNPNVPVALLLILFIIGVALAALRVVIQMGEKRLLLNAHENVQSASIKDLWTPHPFWRFVGGQILYALIVVGGLILLIVPGIIWGIKYMFTPFLIIDRGLMPMDAIRESGRITSGHKWELFLFGLALFGINILGFLCLIVGLFVTVPVSTLATVFIYRRLEHQASEVSPVSA
jgi:uncharacterized membrane protein